MYVEAARFQVWQKRMPHVYRITTIPLRRLSERYKQYSIQIAKRNVLVRQRSSQTLDFDGHYKSPSLTIKR